MPTLSRSRRLRPLMGTWRSRASAFAAVVLLALASTSFFAAGHRYDPLAEGIEPGEVARFDSGHSEPDRSPHIEDAALVESPHCPACLLRHRQGTARTAPQPLGHLKPTSARPRLVRRAHSSWDLDLLYDFVRAELDRGDNVPRIPPQRFAVGVHYRGDRLRGGQQCA